MSLTPLNTSRVTPFLAAAYRLLTEIEEHRQSHGTYDDAELSALLHIALYLDDLFPERLHYDELMARAPDLSIPDP